MIRLTLKETESLVANVRISAQETTPGQVCSSCVFISSITSNPARNKFGGASFSAVLFDVESNNNEASQPWREHAYIFIIKAKILISAVTLLINVSFMS